MSKVEFSRPVRVEPLPRDGLEWKIEANEAERAALAKLNGLPGIARLSASFRIDKWRRGVRVEGDLSALVTQTCVVSLEPFDTEIDEPIEVKFLPAGAKASESEEDEPDELVDGSIDLGVVASEFLTLALDPYPRKPGVAFEPPGAGERESSFERLRSIADSDEPD
jgi:hypothetical protein